jgi:hypothetical protein
VARSTGVDTFSKAQKSAREIGMCAAMRLIHNSDNRGERMGGEGVLAGRSSRVATSPGSAFWEREPDLPAPGNPSRVEPK